MKKQIEGTDWLRMIEWLLLALIFYATSLVLLHLGEGGPIQTVFWKLGHVTAGTFLGYWIDRFAYRDRIDRNSHPMVMLRRAIVMGFAMWTLGAGL